MDKSFLDFSIKMLKSVLKREKSLHDYSIMDINMIIGYLEEDLKRKEAQC